MSHRVHVFTFKTGLLSRVAHDLRLRVERFSITREADEIVASFQVDSLRVDGVMRDGRLDPGGLGARDQAKVVATIQAEILDARRHPQIRFRGALAPGDPPRVTGELELAGVTRALVVGTRRAGDRLLASATLQPSRHGIAPYKALAGAIRLQDRVRVELDLDAARLELEAPASA